MKQIQALWEGRPAPSHHRDPESSPPSLPRSSASAGRDRARHGAALFRSDPAAAGEVVSALEKPTACPFDPRDTAIMVRKGRPRPDPHGACNKDLPGRRPAGYEIRTVSGLAPPARCSMPPTGAPRRANLAPVPSVSSNVRAARVHLSTPVNAVLFAQHRRQSASVTVTMLSAARSTRAFQAKAIRLSRPRLLRDRA